MYIVKFTGKHTDDIKAITAINNPRGRQGTTIIKTTQTTGKRGAAATNIIETHINAPYRHLIVQLLPWVLMYAVIWLLAGTGQFWQLFSSGSGSTASAPLGLGIMRNWCLASLGVIDAMVWCFNKNALATYTKELLIEQENLRNKKLQQKNDNSRKVIKFRKLRDKIRSQRALNKNGTGDENNSSEFVHSQFSIRLNLLNGESTGDKNNTSNNNSNNNSNSPSNNYNNKKYSKNRNTTDGNLTPIMGKYSSNSNSINRFNKFGNNSGNNNGNNSGNNNNNETDRLTENSGDGDTLVDSNDDATHTAIDSYDYRYAKMTDMTDITIKNRNKMTITPMQWALSDTIHEPSHTQDTVTAEDPRRHYGGHIRPPTVSILEEAPESLV